MENKRIGIREIAKLAGVSVATVSRVINTPELTSEEARKKVNAVINEYNYVPNLMAKNLFSKDYNSLAVFVLDLENPFFVALVKELNNIAFQHKQTLIICDTENSPEKEQEYLRYCEAIRVKGIIITEGLTSSTLYDSKINQKLVFLDRKVSPEFTTVRSDSLTGITKAIDYLYNLNHRRFGFVGSTDSLSLTSVEERARIFKDVLSNKGIEVDPSFMFKGSLSAKTGAKALDYYCTLGAPPTAILCANDQIAYGFIARAYALGVKIPGDFSIVGFDGCSSGFLYPKLTTVRQNIPKLALELYNAINSDEPPQEKIIDISLSIGDTCRML